MLLALGLCPRNDVARCQKEAMRRWRDYYRSDRQGPGRRRRGLSPAHRPLPARPAGALLPAPWFGARCRGRVAGDFAGGLAGLGSFAGRSSIRTWLYRVATSRCVNALRSSRRRPSTDQPMLDPYLPEPTRLGDVLWLEPYPDVLWRALPIMLRARRPATWLEKLSRRHS